MAEILRLVQGATQISLINGTNGIHLGEWIMSIPPLKGGGVFANSPISSGRRIVLGEYDYPTEQFPISISGATQELAEANLATLQSFLSGGVLAYWTSSFLLDIPYIEFKADNSTTIYSYIIAGWIDRLSNPFGRHFVLGGSGGPTIDGVTLNIIRSFWTTDQPGTHATVSISNQVSYGGRTLQPAANASNKTFVSNHRASNNLTHVYRYDSSATSYSSNLLDASLPYNLFPSSTGVDDAIYFGIEQSVANSGPFFNLIFNIGTAAVGTYTTIWELYNGSIWTGIFPVLDVTSDTDEDGADSFRLTGPRNVSWEDMNQNVVSVNGVTAYWVRCRISAFTSMSTIPQQATDQIYSARSPHVDILASQVPGQLPSLAHIRITGRSLGLLGGVVPSGSGDTSTWIATRSLSRGSDFVAFINLADEQNPSDITVSLAPATCTFENDDDSPTGRRVNYNPTGVDVMGTKITVTISQPLSAQYTGKFRAFLRVRQNVGSSGQIQMRLRSIIGFDVNSAFTVTSTLDTVILPTPFSTFSRKLIDMGEITIVGGSQFRSTEVPDILGIEIQLAADSGTPNMWLYDLILMPADETILQLPDQLNSDYYYEQYLAIDSTLHPKTTARSYAASLSTDRIAFLRDLVNSGPIVLASQEDQRMWFLFYSYSNHDSYQGTIASIQIFANNRFLTP